MVRYVALITRRRPAPYSMELVADLMLRCGNVKLPWKFLNALSLAAYHIADQ